ncbi:MAG: M15 family metallopeptidase [Candidatus Vogelbacteria bacterium]|nr:M15 family metallopeptidase [Candidatus Vogelbacteria bacterium]
MTFPEFNLRNILVIVGLLIVVIFTFGYVGYNLLDLQKTNMYLIDELVKIQGATSSTTEILVNQKKALGNSLQAEQAKNTVFEGQINQITSTVDELNKLRKLDPELLKKYSKVYFLSENYVPAELSVIDAKYLFQSGRPELFQTYAKPFLYNMIEAAKHDGTILQVVSAYRSFYDQQSVKSGYKVTYGVGSANSFSADQGYSEHQLGTAIDLTATDTKIAFVNFDKAPSYKWLSDNAYKYGFVLSYPKGNTYYKFEPWHWRFVGVKLATKLYENHAHFYDLAQREIDNYLPVIFD